MSGYVIARENFKEAAKHVSAETDPVMFNLLSGLQGLTDQIEEDLRSLRTELRGPQQAQPSKSGKKPVSKKKPAKATRKNTKKRGR